MISAIVAVDNNYGIGNKNGLLAHIPEDLKMFKELTTNNAVIMGRKTYDSLPVKPLPNRFNIVITSKADEADGWENVMDNDKRYTIANMEYIKNVFMKVYSRDIFVMGGGTVYRELLPYCDRVYLTKILHSYEEVDTYFPNIDIMSEWALTSESEEKEHEGVKYKFCVYDRVYNNAYKKVFIINGSGGVGKDKFIEAVQRNVDAEYIVKSYSSVDKVKEIAMAAGWNGSKTERDRKFLSDLKRITTEYNEMPLNDMVEFADEFMNSNPVYNKILFLHIREPIEIKKAIDAFKKYNAETVLVTRGSVEHITSNDSDRSVFDYTYDIIIQNDDSLSDLEDSAVVFINEFIY